jgi:hypothetical protein
MTDDNQPTSDAIAGALPSLRRRLSTADLQTDGIAPIGVKSQFAPNAPN